MPQDPVRSALTTEYVQTLLKIKANQLARRPEFRKDDPDDIKQDLIKHVLKQADNFDPSRAGVNTFITRVVETAAAMLVRSQKREKRAPGHRAMSLEGTLLKGDGREASMADFIDEVDLRRRCGTDASSDQDASDLRTDLADTLKELPPELRRVAVRLPNSTEASIARDLGISRRQVRKAMAAISQARAITSNISNETPWVMGPRHDIRRPVDSHSRFF